MRAAARAAKGKGEIPPILWKKKVASPPSWSEFDALPYRELVIAQALDNVYTVVDAWTHGRHSPEIDRYYAHLVGQGIAGKGIT